MLCSVLLGLSLLYVTLCFPIGYQYGIIIDGGSSSSKLHVYRWHPKQNVHTVPVFEEILYRKFRPGVASYYPDLEPIAEYVQDIIQVLVNDVMPPDEVNKTRISFLATAGLRFLNEDAARSVLNQIRSVLGNKSITPFLFDDNDVAAMSGEEEAVYSWLTVNYHHGTFDRQNQPKNIGMIEVGGGSVQVAYTADVPIYGGKQRIRIAGMTHDLYTHSYLSYGSGSMASRIQWYLLRENPHATALLNPCMLKDDKRSVEIRGKAVDIYGGGNFTECSRIIKEFLQAAPDFLCSPKPCTIGGVYAPPIPDTEFFGLGNIYATASELGVLNDTWKLDIQLLRSRASYFCTKNLTEALEEFNVKEKWASSDCQNGLYLPMMLNKLGFHDNNQHIKSLKIGSSWSIGALLQRVETEYIRDCVTNGGMC